MLALALTFLAAAFILGPDLLSRLILGFVVPRRISPQNRGEEVTRALLWVAVPLIITIVWFRFDHVLSRWGSWSDIETVVSALYSSTYFDAHRSEFFLDVGRVVGMCSSLLWRLYLLVFLAALLLDLAIIRYRWLRAAIKSPWGKAALATIVLPRVSEWHVLLSDMLLPADDVILVVDVLTKNGTLYQGVVQDRMLAADGSLQTLTLGDPSRFLRDEYKEAKRVDASAKVESFWRPIPSKLFLVMGSDIINVNVRYLPKPTSGSTLKQLQLTAKELEDVKALLAKLSASQAQP